MTSTNTEHLLLALHDDNTIEADRASFVQWLDAAALAYEQDDHRLAVDLLRIALVSLDVGRTFPLDGVS